jgi:hypothetical protein
MNNKRKMKIKISRRKEVTMTRAKINDIENRKAILKNQ